jgi:multisubunit Na+/H+ antiporter MnhB subunit
MIHMDKIAPYWKAVLAFIAPGAVTIGSAVTEASDGGTRITTAEWVAAAVACIVTSAAVYAVPNRDPRALHQDESVQPPEYGHVDLATVLLVGILVILVLVVVGVV